MPLRCHGVGSGWSLVLVRHLDMIRDWTARPIIVGVRVLLRAEVRSGWSLVLVCHLYMIGGRGALPISAPPSRRANVIESVRVQISGLTWSWAPTSARPYISRLSPPLRAGWRAAVSRSRQ